jgi:hypothetical protein
MGLFEQNPIVFWAAVFIVAWFAASIRDRVRLLIARLRAAKLPPRPRY